jgi:hypothetical protein
LKGSCQSFETFLLSFVSCSLKYFPDFVPHSSKYKVQSTLFKIQLWLIIDPQISTIQSSTEQKTVFRSPVSPERKGAVRERQAPRQHMSCVPHALVCIAMHAPSTQASHIKTTATKLFCFICVSWNRPQMREGPLKSSPLSRSF